LLCSAEIADGLDAAHSRVSSTGHQAANIFSQARARKVLDFGWQGAPAVSSADAYAMTAAIDEDT